MLGTPVALVGVEAELLCVAVMLAASPDVELGVVEPVVALVVLDGELGGAVAVLCPLELGSALAELGAAEALLEAL